MTRSQKDKHISLRLVSHCTSFSTVRFLCLFTLHSLLSCNQETLSWCSTFAADEQWHRNSATTFGLKTTFSHTGNEVQPCRKQELIFFKWFEGRHLWVNLFAQLFKNYSSELKQAMKKQKKSSCILMVWHGMACWQFLFLARVKYS